MQRLPETMDKPRGNALIQYREVNVIFETSQEDGTTTKGRIIYVNEAQSNYPTVLTHPPSLLGRPVFFSEDTYAVHFLYNDALIIVVHIGCCTVSRILVDKVSSVNILYGHAPD